MFGLEQLPRTLAAARRDSSHHRRHVRLSVVNDLVRLSHGAPGDRPEALSLIARMLSDDPEPEVRARAAIALADGEAGAEHLPALLAAARSEHVGVAEMALAALREVSPEGDTRVTRLVEALAKSEHGALRFQAVGVAARVSDEAEFVGCLQALLSDPDAKVRGHALRVAGERFGQAVPMLIEEQVRSALSAQDRWIRVAAALWLAPLGNEQAKSLIVRAIDSRWALPNPEDEQALIEIAGELGLDAAVPGLRRYARGWLGLVPGRFAWQARVALARLGDEASRRAITQGLESRQAHVRAASALAVGRARLHGCRPRVEALLEQGKLEPELAHDVLKDLTAE